MAPADDPGPEGAATLGEELRALNDEVSAAVSAEVGYQAARARLVAGAAARVAGYGLLALAALYFVLMAVVLGAIVALAPWLGGWGATGAVVLALLVLTALAGLGVLRGVRQISALLAEPKDPA